MKIRLHKVRWFSARGRNRRLRGRRIRQTLVFGAALVAAWADSGVVSLAQQAGLVGSFAQRFADLNQNGPGFLYYGATGADRGLGYNGGYMTLGGFIPYGEDGFGGIWNIDARSHLSSYGGFFNNLGVVRKQFIGGMVGGLGVYWDYDGDQNQYIDMATPTALPGFNMAQAFGQAFNQVGVSGELLTDYGNGRVNGYLPTDSTGITRGTPTQPFFGNYLLQQTGFYGALTGVDGEVGAYVPGLADWAGMWSVGGYCYGAPNLGQSMPTRSNSFGGVYTRIDATFARNWDFQIQANNDSFFDWTGFVTLTYRMGGSRRRNVPDQMEQPMQRNAHVVRYVRNPVAAANPATGNLWNVIHVDNTASNGGNGSVESPYNHLASSGNSANSAVDPATGLIKVPGGFSPQDSILFVRRGTGTPLNYSADTSVQLLAGQRMLGEGVPHQIPRSPSGFVSIGGDSGQTPVLTGGPVGPPAGPVVQLAGEGAILSGFRIQDATIGVGANASLAPDPAFGPALIDRVTLVDCPTGLDFTDVAGDVTVNKTLIDGSGVGVDFFDSTGAGSALTGTFRFRETEIRNATVHSFRVGDSTPGSNSGGSANIDFRGRMEQDGGGEIVRIENTVPGGVIRLATGAKVGDMQNEIVQTGGQGILVNAAGGGVAIGAFKISGASPAAGNGSVDVKESAGTVQLINGEVTSSAAVGIQVVDSNAIVESTRVIDSAGDGIVARAAGGTANVLLEENTVSSQVSPIGNAINLQANAGQTLNATLVANAARGNVAGAFTGGVNRGLFVGAAGTVNLNAPQNSFTDVPTPVVNPLPPPPFVPYPGIEFNAAAGGTINVTQASVADFETRNGGNVVQSGPGAVVYGQPAPVPPVAP